jgi:hypothetical protein
MRSLSENRAFRQLCALLPFPSDQRDSAPVAIVAVAPAGSCHAAGDAGRSLLRSGRTLGRSA